MTIRHLAALCASAVLLTACGGGGGGTPPPLSCSVADQKTWLRDYFDDWYLWYALAPRPAPAGFDTVQAYFDASLFGGNATFPADRYSYFGPTEDFQRFFGDGITRGYGLFVAGVEVEGRPDLPLRIRFIEPQSDAATKGLLRGEQIDLSDRTKVKPQRVKVCVGANLAGTDRRGGCGGRGGNPGFLEFRLTLNRGSGLKTGRSIVGRAHSQVRLFLADQVDALIGEPGVQFLHLGAGDVELRNRFRDSINGQVSTLPAGSGQYLQLLGFELHNYPQITNSHYWKP